MSFDLKLNGGDIVVKTGDFQTVENGDKLVQDVLKIVSTPIGGNVYFPSYGSPIGGTLIGTAYDQKFVSDIASQQLRRSLEWMQRAQVEQAKTGQNVTPHEQLASILDVNVNRAANDPRYFLVRLTVLSKAFVKENISFAVSGN
jgi:phage baseplate assembly protein W